MATPKKPLNTSTKKASDEEDDDMDDDNDEDGPRSNGAAEVGVSITRVSSNDSPEEEDIEPPPIPLRSRNE